MGDSHHSRNHEVASRQRAAVTMPRSRLEWKPYGASAGVREPTALRNARAPPHSSATATGISTQRRERAVIDFINCSPGLFVAQLEAELTLRSRRLALLQQIRELETNGDDIAPLGSRLNVFIRSFVLRLRSGQGREPAGPEFD